VQKKKKIVCHIKKLSNVALQQPFKKEKKVTNWRWSEKWSYILSEVS